MILIIDGDNMLHRAYWSSKYYSLMNSKGQDVSVVFSCLRMVKSYAEMYKTNNIWVAWDKKLLWPSTNFRKEAIQIKQVKSKTSGNLHYKGLRDTDVAGKIHEQEDDLLLALKYLGVKNMNPRVMEADDVISWLSQNLDGEKVIISSDKDLLQLINDKVKVYDGVTKKECRLDNFEEITKVKKEIYLLYKAIVGDSSDNIKGLYGYGPKKAKVLAEKYLQGHTTELNDEQINILKTNLTLMDLTKGYAVQEFEEASYKEQADLLMNQSCELDTFKEFCREKEFASILDNFENWSNVFSGQWDAITKTGTKVFKVKLNG
jgi:5'-3' exonuclease